LIKRNSTRVYNIYKPAIRIPSELFLQIAEDVAAIKSQSANPNSTLAFLRNATEATYSGPLEELIYPATSSGPRKLYGFAQAERQAQQLQHQQTLHARLVHFAFINELRCNRMPIYGLDLVRVPFVDWLFLLMIWMADEIGEVGEFGWASSSHRRGPTEVF